MNKRNFLKGLLTGIVGACGINKISATTPIVKSHLRIWKIGSVEHKIFPSQEAIETLAEKICWINDAMSKGDSVDFVYGPDLEVVTIEGTPISLDLIELPDGTYRRVKREIT